MKKIWIGGIGSCGNHNAKEMITNYIKSANYEFVKEVNDADFIIITDTCVASYQNFAISFDYIEWIISEAKPKTPIVVSGCLANGVKFELTKKQKEILSKVTCIKEKDIASYTSKLLLGKESQDAYDIPYSVEFRSLSVIPVFGCLNHCSFCKSHYANFELASQPFEKVESMARDIEDLDDSLPNIRIHIQSSNLSLYGVDLYGRQRAHEVIHTLTSPKKIKFAYAGSLINWYQELVDEIINNPKIKEIFISLESGSPRVYELMNRPISFENLIRVIKFIRKERPDIIIDSEVIAGFPTESFDDLKRTINLIYELDVYPMYVWPFQNSQQIPASKLPQHSIAYCNEAKKYLEEHLEYLVSKFETKISNGESLVIRKFDEKRAYFVMLINGRRRAIGYDQLEREYEVGELIPANAVIPNQIVRRRKNK